MRISLATKLQELFQERRRCERERVLIAAHLRCQSGTVRSVLLNLSRTGAMMAAVSPPNVGEDLVLMCEALEAPAKVVWVKGYQFGLVFTRQIDSQQVASIVALAGGKGAGR